MPFLKSGHFPKQLFFRFIVQQVFVVVPILLLAALGVRLYLEARLSHLSSVDEVIAAYDRAYLFLAVVMALTITGISLWTAYRLVLPLGRILVKARSILKREYAQAARHDLAGSSTEVQGEWSDLESAIQRIGKDMQSKDISLLREREEIEAILSAITEAVVAVDNAGNLMFFNSQFVVFFGALDRRQSRISDVFRNPDVLDAFKSTLKEGSARTVNAQLRLRGESEFRYFSLSLAPLKTEEGGVYGAVGVFHDVSELKRMDQVRIDFVANVSHELRTPLTSIKGYAQTLQEDFHEESPSRGFLNAIERNTDRLISLVQDLLSISALESGTDLKKEEVDLKALTGRVTSQLESARHKKNQTLKTEVETPLLWADNGRLEQVLFNLLENSIKYSPAGGEIGIFWQESGDDVVLRVKDSGPGIPTEHHNRIFERFYRIDSARTREQGGTGLGLSIVKHIVQRHGGKVKVEGGPGQGSEFICTFPKKGRP